mmetsp:Transcript_15591/g.38446  ORF Transcript_15591/g.38446 Transcript_15591/m.38446 type:complete len:279 (+) Transcript_15591:45-881(+)
MIDLDEYDGLFQKIEDLFQGLTVPDHELVDTDEKEIIMGPRRDLYSSSIALADERDEIETDFDFLLETEDKISAELLELNDLMRSGSKDDRRSEREMPESLGRQVEERVRSFEHKRNGTAELDKAILKQLEEFRVSGRTKQDCKKQTDEETTREQIDTLRHISGSQDEVHIFQSNSQIDSLDASHHEKCNIYPKNESPIMQEETAEVTIFHGDLEVEIDEFEKITSERGLKETYPLEFPGRSPSPPKCAKSLLFRDPSITSSSSEESSLLWLEEKLEI